MVELSLHPGGGRGEIIGPPQEWDGGPGAIKDARLLSLSACD